jgi:hypothetical protein
MASGIKDLMQLGSFRFKYQRSKRHFNYRRLQSPFRRHLPSPFWFAWCRPRLRAVFYPPYA